VLAERCHPPGDSVGEPVGTGMAKGQRTRQCFVSDYGRCFYLVLAIVGAVVSYVFFIQHFSTERPSPVLLVLLKLCSGLSCALPAYLYARERAAS
jgi:hypothetical protein